MCPLRAQPINNSSRVPRYQNSQEVVGLCNFLVKPLPWRGLRGLGRRLKPILMKKGLGLMEVPMIGGTDGAVRGELSSLRLSRVVTEVNNVKGLERGLRSLIMKEGVGWLEVYSI